MHEEELLAGGNVTAGVVRVGHTVRRPIGPWSPAVHALLRHLEEVGFRPAPRFLGIDERNREILSYAPGVTMWPDAIEILTADESVRRVGDLLGWLHRAVAGFVPPLEAEGWTGSADPDGGCLVIHGDFAPWNLIVDGSDWTLIDWDSAGPGRAEWELAYAIHTFVPLWHDSTFSDRRTADRVRAFADGYGATDEQLRESLALAPERCRQVVRFIRARAAEGDEAFLRMAAEGHSERWLEAAAHITGKLTTWTRLLHLD